VDASRAGPSRKTLTIRCAAFPMRIPQRPCAGRRPHALMP
jgi:hypothetical protein